MNIRCLSEIKEKKHTVSLVYAEDLKTKARILVPPESGRTMFGVLDETDSLEYGQVFVQYSNDIFRYKVTDPTIILEGWL